MDAETATLFLIGCPRVKAADGEPVPISSSKGLALLALLALSERAERSRVWLQQMLWEGRSKQQAQSSLRAELAGLRRQLGKSNIDCLIVNQRTVRLDRAKIRVDWDGSGPPDASGELLDGIDLEGADAFAAWLDESRAKLERQRRRAAATKIRDEFEALHAPQPQTVARIAVAPTRWARANKHAAAALVMQNLLGLLPRLRWLPVVTSGALVEAASDVMDIDAIADELSARYVIYSEVDEVRGDPSVSFALYEMPGRIIRWSETRSLGTEAANVEAIEKEVARAVSTIAATFDYCEQRHVKPDDDREHGLHTLAWRVRHHIDQFTQADFATARALIETMRAETPYHSEILMLSSNLELWQHWLNRSPPDEFAALAGRIRGAIRADPADARGPLYLGILENWHRHSDAAKEHLRRACNLDPSSASAFTHLGSSHYLGGDPEGAIPLIEHALFLSPLDSKRFFALGEKGTALWMLERHKDVLDIVKAIRATHPGYVLAHVLESAALRALGRDDEAEAALGRLNESKRAACDAMLDWIPFEDRRWSERLRDAARFLPVRRFGPVA
ncbi:hypothetical protein [Novosphingopyxis sp. YJ-S2-01]|uniref:hypothetical protein n=1 Tax=Novosphingopyxis sp. YJ-S2-01 TaxID=2794021 RepID=UPI0018DDF98B|nr:hypothetical protein [Novosphingopyxis sp. YJ-S2-01]MBH9536702.1 hypothetical protein [Novosphingopyxis sp. YJ-S2-01]